MDVMQGQAAQAPAVALELRQRAALRPPQRRQHFDAAGLGRQRSQHEVLLPCVNLSGHTVACSSMPGSDSVPQRFGAGARSGTGARQERLPVRHGCASDTLRRRSRCCQNWAVCRNGWHALHSPSGRAWRQPLHTRRYRVSTAARPSMHELAMWTMHNKRSAGRCSQPALHSMLFGWQGRALRLGRQPSSLAGM
jgi:hypothetical protein